MNPNAQSFQRRCCVVCGFPWSDRHHLRGRTNDPWNLDLLVLCPNHHRCAHILASYVRHRCSPTLDHTRSFCRENFDSEFNSAAVAPVLAGLGVDWEERQRRQTAANEGYRSWSNWEQRATERERAEARALADWDGPYEEFAAAFEQWWTATETEESENDYRLAVS